MIGEDQKLLKRQRSSTIDETEVKKVVNNTVVGLDQLVRESVEESEEDAQRSGAEEDYDKFDE